MPKFILVGKGGSGKDFVATIFENAGYKIARSITTRKRRPCVNHYEAKIEDRYDFLSINEFMDMRVCGEVFEWKQHKFNNCYYGTTVKEWRESHVIILSPSGIYELERRGELRDCTVIYLDRTPYGRGLRRPDEARRRNDYKDFKDFNAFDYRYTNSAINRRLFERMMLDIRAGLKSDRENETPPAV